MTCWWGEETRRPADLGRCATHQGASLCPADGADLASPEPTHLLTVASLLGLLFSYYASGVSHSLILKTTHGVKEFTKSRKHQSWGQTWALQHSAWPARSEHLVSVCAVCTPAFRLWILCEMLSILTICQYSDIFPLI